MIRIHVVGHPAGGWKNRIEENSIDMDNMDYRQLNSGYFGRPTGVLGAVGNS